MSYTGSVIDNDISINGENLKVKAYTTASLYVQYDLKGGFTDGTQLRVGVRNITNAQPPIDSGSFGYMGSLHSPIPRYWYVNVRKTF